MRVKILTVGFTKQIYFCYSMNRSSPTHDIGEYLPKSNHWILDQIDQIDQIASHNQK